MDSTLLLRTFNKNIPIMDFTEIRLSGKTRREHDLLGEMEIPAEYYFGVQTMRAVEASYEKNKERWVDTLFSLIVGVQP